MNVPTFRRGLFQAFAPRRGSDNLKGIVTSPPGNFNPRSPWGERRPSCPCSSKRTNFNPRSPWGERQRAPVSRDPHLPFQSTLPVGGATQKLRAGRIIRKISIHAPRGGSDAHRHSKLIGSGKFQSTLPVGGATRLHRWDAVPQAISIHAPRGGSDGIVKKPVFAVPNFNPRSPWGERLVFTV